MRRLPLFLSVLVLVLGCEAELEFSSIPCVSAADCPVYAACGADGVCVRSSPHLDAAIACDDDSDCPTNGVCQPTIKLCIPETSVVDLCGGLLCADGEVCLPSVGQCVEVCDLVACDEGTVCDPATGACVIDEEPEAADVLREGCDYAGFNEHADGQILSFNNVRTWRGIWGSERYAGRYAVVQIQTRPDYGGATAPGSYEVGGDGSLNYADAGNPILVGDNCEGDQCERLFFIQSGVLELTEVSDDNLVGVLQDAVLAEVSVDFSTGESVLLEDGEVWCIDDLAFGVPTEDPNEIDDANEPEDDPNASEDDPTDPEDDPNDPEGDPNASEDDPVMPEANPIGSAEEACVDAGNGVFLGANIANLTLTNCLGEEVELHDSCGKRAQWLIGTSGWCSGCSAYLQMVRDLHFNGEMLSDDNQPADLDVWVILHSDPSDSEPTPAYCVQYAMSNNIDPGKMFLDWDNDGQSFPSADDPAKTYTTTHMAMTWSTVNPHIRNNSLGLPWEAVLDGANMEYVWVNQQDRSTNGALKVNEMLSE